MTWEAYGEELDVHLHALHDRVHSGAYRALPSLRVEIPKPDGGTRPLGIAALEDKIVKCCAQHLTINVAQQVMLRRVRNLLIGKSSNIFCAT